MTKADLLDALADYPDAAEVVLEGYRLGPDQEDRSYIPVHVEGYTTELGGESCHGISIYGIRIEDQFNSKYERAKYRPANYESLDAEGQYAVDKALGILDWDGKDDRPNPQTV